MAPLAQDADVTVGNEGSGAATLTASPNHTAVAAQAACGDAVVESTVGVNEQQRSQRLLKRKRTKLQLRTLRAQPRASGAPSQAAADGSRQRGAL